MDLSRRLALLRRASAPAVVEEAPSDPRVAELRQRLDALVARQKAAARAAPQVLVPRPATLQGELPGQSRKTAYGEIHLVERSLEPSHLHGRVPVCRASEVAAETVAKIALDPKLSAVAPRGMVYLDTETTGIAGGTGTIPFLVGTAWFEGESLVIEQLVLRRPGEETPMLARVAERIRGASCLVTYNGKSFDWPLLRNRFVLSRVEVPELRAHLDLLPPARRVFKRRLGSARLVHLEAEVLGFRRVGDVEGYEIPTLYWSYVRGASGGVLAPVVEHNANDLIALAGLLVAIVERYENVGPRDHAADQLGLAQVAVRAGDLDRAVHLALAAADGGDGDAAIEALLLAAKIAVRRRAHEDALARLSAAIDRRGSAELTARVHLQLAKIHEHRLRDPARALVHAELAARAESPATHDRRIARLLRRVDRGISSGPNRPATTHACAADHSSSSPSRRTQSST